MIKGNIDMQKLFELKYRRKIDRLGIWYQPIKFLPGLKTPVKYSYLSTIYGVRKWKMVRKVLPKNLRNKKILELGSSSGLYSILLAKEGAKVTAVEIDKRSYNQALLTREIFSEIDKVDYSKQITILNKNCLNMKFEKYDIVIALNVFYWLGNAQSFINKLKKHTKMIIVQGDENKYHYRISKSRSTFMTNNKKIEQSLKKGGFSSIKLYQPMNLKGIVNVFLVFLRNKGMLEIDMHNPFLTSRGIVLGLNNGKNN